MGVKHGYKQSAEHVRKRMSARLATLKRTEKSVTKEWLVRRYWTDGSTCVAIGLELGKDAKTVWAWLRHYQIPTRPRGHSTAHLPAGRAPGFAVSGETREKLRTIRLTDGHVPYLKNGQHWLKTAAPEEHPNWRGGISAERQALYASSEWKKAAQAVYARDKKTCQRCGKRRHEGDAFDIHHIVPFEVARLRTELSNLVLLCEPCHYWVHSKENTERLWVKPCT
jgi:hypothetical protein